MVISRTLISAAVVAALLMPQIVLACEDLVEGPRGTVTEVVDGDTVFLDNGLQVRLVGTQAPKLPLGREGFETWPLAREAKGALEDLVLGQKVVVRYGGEDRDRYDRVLGQVFVQVGGGEVWIQEKMLLDGLARVYSFADNRSCLATLMAAEARARTMQLGIWRDPYYQIRRADRPQALLERLDHYELVEGRVLLAEAAGQGVYLNFGRVWKEDFTVVIGGGALRLFADSGLDPLMLEGALIRVRGWVDERDGPRIEVTHPEQIEVLSTR